MKLIGTRIRVETSKHKTEYFPEYCLEYRTWYGKIKQKWFGIDSLSSHCFGEAYRAATVHPYCSEAWAKEVISYQAKYYARQMQENEHKETKQTSYVKYP